MQLIYSSEKVENAGGRKVKNPRHFLVPVSGVTKVFLNGHWPKVRQAYEQAGVPVSLIEDMRSPPGRAKAGLKPDEPPANAEANLP